WRERFMNYLEEKTDGEAMINSIQNVGLTMRISLLYRGEYLQWRERFMNYLEEKTDGEAMIISIQNDPKFWTTEEKKTQKINRLAISLLIQGLPNDIYSLIDSNETAKDLWDALERKMRGSEYGEQDRKAAILNVVTRKTTQNQGDVNDALGYKKKVVVVTLDPLALIAEKTNSANKKQEFVKTDDKKVEKKVDEKKIDMSKEINANMVFMAQIKKVLSESDESSSSVEETIAEEINANMVFMAQIKKVLSESDESSSSVEETIAEGGNAAGYGEAQNRVGNVNQSQVRPGQARTVKCYNCNGTGHIARNCTQPKRPQNSEYFKDKMLLMQAQENRVALDAEQLLFLAGGPDNAFDDDDDVDEQPVQDLALNVDNVFQAEDCNAFDSDVDEAPTAQTMFMAKRRALNLRNPLLHAKEMKPERSKGWFLEICQTLPVLKLGYVLCHDAVAFCLRRPPAFLLKDTRPPMLDRTDFASWQQRIRLYCRGKDNGVNILKSIDEGPYKLGTFRETLAESTEGTPQFGPERSRIYSDLNSVERDRYNADIRATNILLKGLPKDIYTLINHYTDAKDIWDNVKMLLEGSELTKEDRESQLYDEFEHFRQHKEESINDYYVRGLRESNYDQLFAYLKQHEAHAKENKMVLERLAQPIAQPTADPLALLSNVSNAQHGLPSLSTSSITPLTPPCANSTDDLIENLTSTLALLTQSYRTFLPQTNNQLRTSSNPKNQATDLALNVDNVFQAEDCDAFDSDVDEAPTAQTMFMANLSSADPISDEAGPSYDSDILSEV
nr:retrovirus-related Pol polyprotein from transposon TNT 1-94 [Tanacetum cinerariifolium]